MYVLGLPACLRAALSRSVVGSHVGHTRAARGGAFGVERPETPFQTIIGTRNRDRNTRDAKEYPKTIPSEIQGGRPLHFLRVLSWVPLLEYGTIY